MLYNFIIVLLFTFSNLSGVQKLESRDDFVHYSKCIENERFIKFLVDVHTGDLEFFDVNRYPLHLDYYLTLEGSSYDGYLANYNGFKPEYIYGSLIHHEREDLWTLTLWEGDRATLDDIVLAYTSVRDGFYEGSKLYFRPTSTYQEEVVAKSEMPIITNDQLFKQSSFQMLHVGKNVGRLQIGLDGATEDAIVILKEFVPDTPKVAGIILEQFSTPLSHLALRARAWNIPHARIQEASSLFEQLVGKRVFFEVSAGGYTLRAAQDDEKTAKGELTPIEIQKPNMEEDGLKPLKLLYKSAYGEKAGTLGEIARLGIKTADGFGIPFYYYEAHMQQSGAYLEESLEKRRKKILEHPLDPRLSSLFESGVFVRSSTNCEDLQGFAAAGLYDTVANVYDENAIKQVWASLWTENAVKERSRASIDDANVSCAVLVQQAMNATSSGVLVTKDIFDPTEFMEVYTINASFGLGINVVDGKLLPEQLLYNYDNKGIKVLSRTECKEVIALDERGGTKSIPPPNLPYVLSDAQVTKLGNVAHLLKKHFKMNLDIEWLFVDDTLYILQARPF